MPFPIRAIHAGFVLVVLMLVCPSLLLAAVERPNIVVILADDLGYGDVHCNNPDRGKIATPHIDRLAKQGMRFTDAHTSSGVCSPTRYALLTGRYHWRSRLQAGIVTYLEKPLIAPERLTLAGLLKQQGYRSAAIGKWHLGWDWSISREQRELFAPARNEPVPKVTEAHRAAWREVYSKPIQGGPTTRGFDEYFGTDVPNWPPYAFIHNDRTVGIPSEFLPAALLKGQLASLPGPALADWKLESILPSLGDRACEFIERSAKQPQPFFLYMPLTAPHTPIAVNAEWQGKSGLNRYADFVMETDAVVGRVLAALEKSGVSEKTLVIFTSDNGCSPLAQIPELQRLGHFPSGPLRGHKTDAWEGGHRVPFIVRWPSVVRPDSRCDQLAHQADLMATFADLLSVKLPDNAGEDSVSLLPLFRGDSKPIREHAVSHSSTGLASLRKGTWKIIFGSGPRTEGGAARKKSASGDDTPGQLYDLATDLGETINLWSKQPALVAELTETMTRIVNSGRSTPGPQQANDVPVQWRRFLDSEK